jgi:hypothetical protein
MAARRVELMVFALRATCHRTWPRGSLAGLVAPVLGLASASAQTQNLIVNGSFEAGASQVCNQNCVSGLVGWSSGSWCDIDWVRIGGCSTPCEVAWPPPDGVAFIDLSGSTGTHGSLRQNVQLEPGRLYRLSFVAGGNCSGDATTKWLRVQAGPVVREYEIACAGNSCWKWEAPDHVDFVAVEVSTQVRFTSVAPGNPNHGPTIDDVFLQPWPPPCPGDLLEDGFVNGVDLGMLLGSWGPCKRGCQADLNGDGSVDGADLGALLNGWGPCVP